MRKFTIMSALMLTCICANAQMKIGANPTIISASSALEVEATNKGFLMPRVALLSSTDVITIANPAKGLQVFNIKTSGDVDSNFVYWFNGNKWLRPLTSQQGFGSTASQAFTWSANTPTAQLLTQNQVYVLGPFTVSQSGYYSFNSRMFYNTFLTSPPLVATMSFAICENDGTLNMYGGAFYDVRFVISSASVNATAPSLTYMKANTNYFMKYFADSPQCYVSAGKEMILTLVK